MAYTFETAVSNTLKRVGVIQGDSGALTSFTDSARQTDIDVAIQVWNEMMQELYDQSLIDHGGLATGLITLTTGTGGREYSLATDFEKFSGGDVLLRSTNGDNWQIVEYPGGYVQMVNDQITATEYRGQPTRAVINPTNGKLRLDTDPGNDESGDTYGYLYEKRISLTATGDTFPFSDTVVDALLPAVSLKWKRERHNEDFTEREFNKSFSRASSFLTKRQPSTQYGRRTLGRR